MKRKLALVMAGVLLISNSSPAGVSSFAGETTQTATGGALVVPGGDGGSISSLLKSVRGL